MLAYRLPLINLYTAHFSLRPLKEVQTNVHKKPYFIVINSKAYLQVIYKCLPFSYRLKKNINMEQRMIDSFSLPRKKERKRWEFDDRLILSPSLFLFRITCNKYNCRCDFKENISFFMQIKTNNLQYFKLTNNHLTT